MALASNASARLTPCVLARCCRSPSLCLHGLRRFGFACSSGQSPAEDFRPRGLRPIAWRSLACLRRVPSGLRLSLRIFGPLEARARPACARPWLTPRVRIRRALISLALDRLRPSAHSPPRHGSAFASPRVASSVALGVRYFLGLRLGLSERCNDILRALDACDRRRLRRAPPVNHATPVPPACALEPSPAVAFGLPPALALARAGVPPRDLRLLGWRSDLHQASSARGAPSN